MAYNVRETYIHQLHLILPPLTWSNHLQVDKIVVFMNSFLVWFLESFSKKTPIRWNLHRGSTSNARIRRCTTTTAATAFHRCRRWRWKGREGWRWCQRWPRWFWWCRASPMIRLLSIWKTPPGRGFFSNRKWWTCLAISLGVLVYFNWNWSVAFLGWSL